MSEARPPIEAPDSFAHLRRCLELLGVTYQIQCGRGIHGAIIGGRNETWAEGATDEEALGKAVSMWARQVDIDAL